MTLLIVKNIEKTGTDGFVLSDINFTITSFQKIALAGETGSGKSTLLKIIAGLVQPDQGLVELDGEVIKGPDEQLVAGNPRIAYLSQHFELQKHLRVEQVLAYANQIPEQEAHRIYSICRITHVLQRKTDQLSGGEKQRVAIARLLIGKPRLLLLDEPYTNLDRIVKDDLKNVIEAIGNKLKITCMIVSHDPEDTLGWADQIIVLKAGRLVQLGSPETIYRSPKSEYVAGLFGTYTILKANLLKKLGLEKRKRAIVRPEDFKLQRKTVRSVAGKVVDCFYLGNRYELEVRLMDQIVRVSSTKALPIGDTVYVKLQSSLMQSLSE